MSAAVLRSKAAGQRGAEPERKPPLSGRGAKPVSDDSGRRNGAKWKRQPVERFTGGAAMERSGDGLNWRSQAPKPADVSLQNLEAQARRHENRSRRIVRRLIGARSWLAEASNLGRPRGPQMLDAFQMHRHCIL